MATAARLAGLVLSTLLFGCGARSELEAQPDGTASGDGGSSAGGPPVGAGAPMGGGVPMGGAEPVGPQPLTSDIFDPAEVYLAGTAAEGACWQNVFVHWAFPWSIIAGADCDYTNTSMVIRHSDGRVLYAMGSDPPVRELRCDACPYDPQTYPDYPEDPTANDVVVHPGCSGVSDFNYHTLVSPDDVVLVRCVDGGYRDASGDVAVFGPEDTLLYALGYGGLVLGFGYLETLYGGAQVAIAGMTPGWLTTVRARPGGFHVVQEVDGGPSQLWDIDASGQATLVGEYPPGPAGITVYGYSSKLDEGLALYSLGTGPDAVQDVIVRRTLEGESAVIYDETNNPVKIHISALFTGP